MTTTTVKLGALGEFRNGLNYTKANSGVGLKVINVKDFGDRIVPELSVVDEINPTGLSIDKALLRQDDILFVRSNGNRALVGRSMRIDHNYEDLSFSAFCIRFRATSPIVDPLFLSYFFRAPSFRQELSLLGKGTNINNLNQEILSSLDIPIPSISEQRRVAELLSAYDDLIENNRRRMVLLEEAARQLYREWFIRLRFPGHEHTRITNGVPEGWKRKTLGDCVTLNYGKALKADDRSDGPFLVYGSSGIVGAHEKCLAQGPGIIVGRKGNVGSVYWCSKGYWPIDTVYFIDTGTSNLWLYYALQHMHFISTDVAVPGLNRDFAYSRPLLVPESRIVRLFLEYAGPLHDQIAKLDEMKGKLRAARDLLFPRLMSGEIAV
ncbi:MAG: restriction endonuclease subunit S [Nitrospira sp.]|nr:restriction endonuclease subunit S [Nitrospira sp.]